MVFRKNPLKHFLRMDFLVRGLAGVAAGFFTNPFNVVKIRMPLQGELCARIIISFERMDFLVGGLAGVAAGFFTNPFDVVKIRMQLQGELRARGQHAVHYRNIPHAMYTIVKHDGWAAIQRGLVPALCFQLVVNGVRLGIYQHADNYGLLRNKEGRTICHRSVCAGAFAGMVGGFFGSPLMLIKTQLMSHSSEKIAVGTQHNHRGMWNAMKKLYRQSGITGLWRSCHGAMMGNAIASSSQIATFSTCKDWMDAHNFFQQSKYLSTFIASNVGAVFKTITLTPIDVIVTRLFNQAVNEKGKGLVYAGVVDCASKIARTEGYIGFYKGVGPCFLRQAPHSVLTLVFWDMLKDLQKSTLKTPS